MANEVYNTMYRFNGQISTTGYVSVIQSSDVVSIAFIHNYDTATYPVIRLRIFADMETITHLTDHPDDIRVAITLYGNIYKTDTDSNTNSIVQPVNEITISGKGYIENKNAPVSSMDHYKSGVKDSTDLNVDSKVPCELFIYDDNISHRMRERVKSVYENATIETVSRDILKQVGFPENNIVIAPMQNQTRYAQILIPNLMAIESFTFFDRYFGIYQSGGLLYCDLTSGSTIVYLSDTYGPNVTSNGVIPIYVRSEKNNSNGESGIFTSGGKYMMQTQALNVSILTESDIESVMNPTYTVAANVVTRQLEASEIPILSDDKYQQSITAKQILHKYDNQYLASTVSARIGEKITEIDLAGAGFDISLFKPNSRIQLVFESPIRGMDMCKLTRIRGVTHVLTNASGDLFASQTTMQLCSNY